MEADVTKPPTKTNVRGRSHLPFADKVVESVLWPFGAVTLLKILVALWDRSREALIRRARTREDIIVVDMGGVRVTTCTASEKAAGVVCSTDAIIFLIQDD